MPRLNRRSRRRAALGRADRVRGILGRRYLASQLGAYMRYKTYKGLVNPYSNMIYRYKQNVKGSEIVGWSSSGGKSTEYQGQPATLAAASFCSFYFKVSDLPQWASFSGLYDQYRLSKVVLRITPNLSGQGYIVSGAGGAATVAGGVSGNLYIVVDHDDANLPTTVQEIREYAKVKEYNALMHTKPIRIVIRPRIATAAYSGAFTSYKNDAATWIDNGSPDVQHYGCKFAIEGSEAGIQQKWRIDATYYVQFKNVR